MSEAANYFRKLLKERSTDRAFASALAVSERTVRNWKKEGVPEYKAESAAKVLKTKAKRIMRS